MAVLLKFVLPALATAIAGVLARKAWNRRTVHEGEHAIVLRFGRVVRRKPEGFPAWYLIHQRFAYWAALGAPPRYRVRWRRQFKRDHAGVVREFGPGVLKTIPGVHQARIERVKMRRISTGEQSVRLADNLVFRVEVAVFYEIADLYKALYGIDDHDQAMRSWMHSKVLKALAGTQALESLDPTALAEDLQVASADRFAELGVGMFSMSFETFEPADEHTRRLLMAPAFSDMVKRLVDGGLGIPESIAIASGNVILNASPHTRWPMSETAADEAPVAPVVNLSVVHDPPSS